jgi:glycogen(starch) synthase
MTILHVLDHSMPVSSGYSSRSRYIVEFQRRLGLRPVVLTSPKHGSAHDGIETIDGIRHHRTGAVVGPSLVREVRLMTRMAARIAAVARAEGARVLHAHSPLLNGLPALLVGRRLALPVVYEARAFWEDAAVDHGTTREGSLRYRLTRALETVLFRRADRVVTICDGMRREIVRRGADPARLAVVPNGVDVEWFQPRPRTEALARQLGLDGGPVFGFVGSFYRYEGLRFLLDALPALRAAISGARLLLVGSGEDERELRARAESIGDGVVFAGQVPHQHVRDFYSLIDVFVCPRRRMRLTEQVTPLKPLEAMAMAMPVLASDVGGLKELIHHDATGLLFRAESGEAFLAEAVRIGRDRDFRATIGAAAHRYVASERAWAPLVARYSQLYAEMA